MTKIKQGWFLASDLKLVAHAPPPDDPPLAIGDVCQLLSGGPDCLVVDEEGTDLVIAWEDDKQAEEHTLPRGCVRRKHA